MLKYNLTTNEIELFSGEDYIWLSHFLFRMRPRKSPLLNYRADWLLSYYHKTCDQGRILRSRDDELTAPYELLHDYSHHDNPEWGSYSFTGDFFLTNELAVVKQEMVNLFTRRGLLYKGDNICPRAASAEVKNGVLSLEIQKAHYFDQVATNLSLDYPLTDSIASALQSKTLREWDGRQSGTEPGRLPSFRKSKLANTIGVALGITAINKRNQRVMLIRKRTKNVAVLQDMFVLPFSFSLNLDKKLCHSHSGSIFDLIKTDFRYEQAEELGLEPNVIDFEHMRPLIFCRELLRGGKPQFFFEIELDIPFEELRKMIREGSSSKKEYKGNVIGLPLDRGRKILRSMSPEVSAFIVAKS